MAKKRITKNRPKTRSAHTKKPSDPARNMVDPNKSYVSVTKPQMIPKSSKSAPPLVKMEYNPTQMPGR